MLVLKVAMRARSMRMSRSLEDIGDIKGSAAVMLGKLKFTVMYLVFAEPFHLVFSWFHMMIHRVIPRQGASLKKFGF